LIDMSHRENARRIDPDRSNDAGSPSVVLTPHDLRNAEDLRGNDA
jgi:hypothetical protein